MGAPYYKTVCMNPVPYDMVKVNKGLGFRVLGLGFSQSQQRLLILKSAQ
jgi:hypothetical protein